MEIQSTLARLILLSIIFVSPVTAQNPCSCEATDRTCTARVRCQAGCTAICGYRDSCYAGCGSIEAELTTRINLSLRRKDGNTIAASLSSLSGRRIQFRTSRRNERFSLELKNDPLWNVLSYLAKRGTVLVDGTDFKRLEKIRHEMGKGKG